MNVYILCLSFLILSDSTAAQKSNPEDIRRKIETKANSIFDSLVNFRRDLHQNPELSGQEVRTANKIRERLIKSGLEVKSNIGGYGVVGILKGKMPGPVIAWRADIDAFKDDSPDTVEFASKVKGVRHICGHDVHATIGLGIAETLKSIENEINGTIMFVFQPAEENATGAKRMLEDGVFAELKPEAIFALHVCPMEAGYIYVKSKEMFSHFTLLKIELEGTDDLDKAANACVDQIKRLDTIPDSINIDDASLLIDPNLGLANQNSIYLNYFALRNVKTEKEKENNIVITAVFSGSSKEICRNAVSELKLKISDTKWQNNIKSISYVFGYPTVYNDPIVTDKAVNMTNSIFGEEVILPLYGVSPIFNDDFADFQEKIPGVYFVLGASNFSKGIISVPHAPFFNVDEKCIEKGVSVFSTLIYEYLRSYKVK
jgi:metal-dependent amidase/aminoacylase/carboxypeptidase family protein